MLTTENYIARIWSVWLWSVMVTIISFAVTPRSVACVFAIFSIWTFFKCVRCAYLSESFTEFASLRILFSLLVSPIMAFLVAMTMTLKLSHLDSVRSLGLSLLCVGPSIVAFLGAYYAKFRQSVFIVRGDRVEVIAPKQANSIFVGAISAGIVSLIYPLMAMYSGSLVVILCIFLFASIYMVYYHRKTISSLKELKRFERETACYYKFAGVEHIRELRHKSFLGRLLGRAFIDL